MNWKKIITTYVKSVNTMMDHYKPDSGWSWLNDIKDRDLYDFFDKQNIVIDIEAGQDKGEWGYTIWDKDGLLANKHHLDNRTETETHAFIKAFELLEKKL